MFTTVFIMCFLLCVCVCIILFISVDYSMFIIVDVCVCVYCCVIKVSCVFSCHTSGHRVCVSALGSVVSVLRQFSSEDGLILLMSLENHVSSHLLLNPYHEGLLMTTRMKKYKSG